MAIAKDEVITAADIEAKNRSYASLSYDASKKQHTFQVINSGTAKDGTVDGYPTVTFYGDPGADLSRFNVRKNGPSGDIIFSYAEGSVTVNTEGFNYVLNSGWLYLYLPNTTDYSYYAGGQVYNFFSGRPRMVYYFRPGQVGITQGDNIRVWDSSFSNLLTEGATLITADIAKKGRLGYAVE